MPFSIAQCVAFMVALLAIAQSVPIEPKSPGDWYETCDVWTLYNQTSENSPRVTDCEQMAINISPGGNWRAGAGGNNYDLATYGTCAFGVKGTKFKIDTAHIGNGDIIQLITESIKRFSSNGMIGAKGEMRCNSDLSYSDMDWAIYHT